MNCCGVFPRARPNVCRLFRVLEGLSSTPRNFTEYSKLCSSKLLTETFIRSPFRVALLAHFHELWTWCCLGNDLTTTESSSADGDASRCAVVETYPSFVRNEAGWILKNFDSPTTNTECPRHTPCSKLRSGQSLRSLLFPLLNKASLANRTVVRLHPRTCADVNHLRAITRMVRLSVSN